MFAAPNRTWLIPFIQVNHMKSKPLTCYLFKCQLLNIRMYVAGVELHANVKRYLPKTKTKKKTMQKKKKVI